jgi:magnesium-transporting ATPase (P-type)
VVVVAVPEGLPMMIAMVLAINMKKLLSVKVLVRKLLGIETAGSLNMLFTDKTGTLTQGRLSVSAFLTGAGVRHDNLEDIPQTLRDTAGFALRNNTSAVIDASDPNDPKMVGADRTEQALLRFVTPYLAQNGNVGYCRSHPVQQHPQILRHPGDRRPDADPGQGRAGSDPAKLSRAVWTLTAIHRILATPMPCKRP